MDTVWLHMLARRVWHQLASLDLRGMTSLARSARYLISGSQGLLKRPVLSKVRTFNFRNQFARARGQEKTHPFPTSLGRFRKCPDQNFPTSQDTPRGGRRATNMEMLRFRHTHETPRLFSMAGVLVATSPVVAHLGLWVWHTAATPTHTGARSWPLPRTTVSLQAHGSPRAHMTWLRGM